MIEARALVYQALAARNAVLTDVEFVLCEDNCTTMINAHTADEHCAVCVCFDLAEGEAFDEARFRRDFFRPIEVPPGQGVREAMRAASDEVH